MKTTDLSGQWKLLLEKDLKIDSIIETPRYFPMTIELPGSVSQQKKSPEISEKSTGYLTDPFLYEGYGWFEKEIELNQTELNLRNNNFYLFFERTRISAVWINDEKTGTFDSLCGFHKYDITNSVRKAYNPADNSVKLKITVLISNVDYATKGGHMTSPDTQTNWLGITGKIEIIEESAIKLDNIFLETEIDPEEKVIILADFVSPKKEVQNYTVDVLIGENTYKYKLSDILLEDSKKIKIEIALDKKIILWSDTNPVLYDVSISLVDEKKEVIFSTCMKHGFRKIYTFKNKIMINGHKIFLRGKHDGMIFPETGFAPTDLSSWMKILKTAKDYGINHYRFHTCCPPQAAFEAADILGIYMSPELPFWGTIQAENEEGFNKKEQEYLITEGFRILKDFGNHPSFTMFSLGNELWGNSQRLDDILKMYKQTDNRHLYTAGSNNFQFWPVSTEHEDYFVGVRLSKNALIRGSYAMCDAPLGFIQTDEPNTNHNYDKFFENNADSSNENLVCSENNETKENQIEIQYGTGVKKVTLNEDKNIFIPEKPVITHEIGQFCMYPNYKENKRFTGVLKPYNFEKFEQRLEKAGMHKQADEFFENSSKLAVQCYKTEIEAALRSENISGFQLLDIQDFTGQGTAVVGVLNAFMESKGIVSGEQWRSFCDETVLLAAFPKYVYSDSEIFTSDILLFNYSENSYNDQEVVAYLVDTETDEILYEESFEILSSDSTEKTDYRGITKLGTLKYDFDKQQKYKKIALLLILQKPQEENSNQEEISTILNSYMLHVYPKVEEKFINAFVELKNKDNISCMDKILTKDFEQAKELAEAGKKVIYFMDEACGQRHLSADYCTDFWCYPMFRSISESMKKPVPIGTLGLNIQKENNLFKYFPTDSYTTPKWYNFLSKACCVDLTNSKIQPVIQMIDNVERNHKLGLLYEDEVFGENLLICTARLYELTDKIECMNFGKSLLLS